MHKYGFRWQLIASYFIANTVAVIAINFTEAGVSISRSRRFAEELAARTERVFSMLERWQDEDGDSEKTK